MSSQDKKRIIIAEDEKHTLHTLTLILKKAGFELETAENGQEAFLKIIEREKSERKFDLLLTDILMPRMNGLEIIRNLKLKKINLPTIVFSGYGDKEMLLEILREGCEDYLDKPFESSELMERIDKFFTKRAKEDALLEAEKERIKSAFIANFSHELRTPAHGLIGAAELLATNELSDEQREEFISDLHNCCDTLLTTVDRIIDLSALESGQLVVKKSTCDLRSIMLEALHGAEEELYKQDKRNLEILFPQSIESLSEIPPLETFPNVISQVLQLLTENSVRFTQEGQIEFLCEVNSKTNLIHFHVKDSGYGIPQEQQATLFESYFRSDDAIPKVFHGSGLSLATAKKLVELVKGKIGFESSEGEGSTFYFEVPYEISIEGIAEITTNDRQEK